MKNRLAWWLGAPLVTLIMVVCATAVPSSASALPGARTAVVSHGKGSTGSPLGPHATTPVPKKSAASPARGSDTTTGPLIVANNAADSGGPIQTYDFGTGTLVNSFVSDGAATSNGRGVAVAGNEVFYTELSGSEFGPSDSIHVAPFTDGAGGNDTRTLPNPAPSDGIQDLDYANGALYALTGYPSGSLQVWKLDPTTGTVLSGPIAINSDPGADGFTVLPDGNFLINGGDASCSYTEYDSATGAPAGFTLSVPGASSCTGVATDGSSLYFQTDFDAFTETDLSGNFISQTTVASNLVEDISLVGNSTAQPRTLVAMGDSYSSGEANRPFDPGTNVNGDKCHRSAGAWPRLLAASDPTITMEAHIACSGAKTKDITSQTFNSEPPQIDQLLALPQPPQLITITIGGNDVGFKSVLENCFLFDCSLDHRLTTTKNYIEKTLPGVLSKTYDAIRIAEPDSLVAVIGYPRLFPLTQKATHNCGWLTPTERTKLNNLATLLDSVIGTAVHNAGFTYVSILNALGGHEECRSHSWLYPIGDRPLVFDAHPIAQGQQALEAVVHQAIG